MGRRIDEDHKHFIDVVSGKFRKELRRLIGTGDIYRLRGDKHIPVRLPKIHQPHLTYGDPDTGIKRGPGQPGDVIGRDPQKGGGNQAGDQEAEGMIVHVDVDSVLELWAEELELPDIKPKDQATFDSYEIKYTGISNIGPESLRHNRRTFLQAIKRLAGAGELDKMHLLPGCKEPMRVVTPIRRDKRYRQYKVHEIPNSNAVIFFARDGSISMDDAKCDVVTDMAFWIENWIRRFYEKTESCYFWHDTLAKEVDKDTFYKLRYGGGTKCSSAFKLMTKQFENRFKPEAWNIYVFYFSDGENLESDNETLLAAIAKEMPPEVVNMVGVTQVLCWNYSSSIKRYLEDRMDNFPQMTNVRMASIGPETSPDPKGGWGEAPKLTEEERGKDIDEAVRKLLGKSKPGFNS
jgi:uncharacterized sporulation protein YeaH/YhbH (DUF444 family)